MKVKLNKRSILQKIKDAALDYEIQSGLLFISFLKEHAPKETKSLIKSFRLTNPVINKGLVVMQIISTVRYARTQDEDIKLHRSDYASEEQDKMAHIADKIHLMPNHKYSKSHQARYYRGLRYLKLGLASNIGVKAIREATNYIDKATDSFLEHQPRLLHNLSKSLTFK
jgi:hypothetical protein